MYLFVSIHWKKNIVLNKAKNIIPLCVSNIDSVMKLIIIINKKIEQMKSLFLKLTNSMKIVRNSKKIKPIIPWSKRY